MLDSIAKLGEELLSESPDLFLKSLIKFKKSPRGEGILLRIIFDTKRKNIKTDALKLTRSRCEEYWWIGNTFKAAREPILRLTSDNLKYFLRENNGIDGIAKTIEKLPKEFKKGSLDELYSYLEKILERFGNLEKIERMIKDKADLYTISITLDSKEIDLAKTKGYRDFLETVLLRVHETVKGSCYLCGSENVLVDPGFPSGSLLKMYVLDKKGFISGISDSDFSKVCTFSICPFCLKKLLTGSGYIERNLRRTIGNINLYLIPRSAIRIKRLEKFLEFIEDKFDAVRSYEKLKEIDKKLRELSPYYGEHIKSESNYTLNIIFGRGEQASFNFYEEITEVPVSSLTSFTENSKMLTKKMGEIFGGEENFDLTFETIYRIFPLSLRKTKGGLKLEGYKPLILLYSSLLHKHAYPKEELVKRALLLARIHRYRLYSAYNILRVTNGDVETCYGIVKFNMLMRLLESKLEAESQEKHRDETFVEDKIMKYFELMKYENWQKALFLIGYLIGEVGRQQYLKGDEKKSILSKVNFDGMGTDKVLMLSNQILKSLRDYRILKYNEALYGEMKKLLDSNLDRLHDPVMNVFYILSGYAFSTLKSIKASSSIVSTNEQ